MNKKLIWPLLAGLIWSMSGCGSASVRPSTSSLSSPGGYYLDDGPGDPPLADLDAIPDAVPRHEPLHRFANRTYVALGNTYVPYTERRVHHEEGLASWYGRRFHGRKTASGEPYDMYAMTAAHPTLPIPSYARVTSLEGGKSVVVRINDRGPFHKGRVIDLSYTAAHKLGFVNRGSGRVRVESVEPDAVAAAAAGLQTVYLQVGAFSQADNARQMRNQLRDRLSLETHRLHVVSSGDLHRVQLGPYASEVAAEPDLQRLKEQMELKPVLVRRD
jgi:rare lipoprotein A